MNDAKRPKLNVILIPKGLCHKFKWHRWFWISSSKALISARCSRCGMGGLEYHRRRGEEQEKEAKKSKKGL